MRGGKKRLKEKRMILTKKRNKQLKRFKRFKTSNKIRNNFSKGDKGTKTERRKLDDRKKKYKRK